MNHHVVGKEALTAPACFGEPCESSLFLQKEALTALPCFGRKKRDVGLPCESHVIWEWLDATGMLRKRDYGVLASLSGIARTTSFEAGN